jgi:CheY-like chemotaxis protein/DNA-binding XRE family transcriptional regulator
MLKKRENTVLPTLLGRIVKRRRQGLGFSQEELAWRADLHRTYVTDVERGARNLSMSTIDRLAQALEIPLSSLLGEVDTLRGVIAGHGQRAKLVDILLVEDNPDDVELTLKAFKKARFANRVHAVSDGQEALDYVFCGAKYSERNSSEDPQLVLLDLNLPKVSGMEVLRRLKGNQGTAKIPVVILTVSHDGYDIEECHRLGAANYIVKPVDFHRLSHATPGLNLDWALLQRDETLSQPSRRPNPDRLCRDR